MTEINKSINKKKNLVSGNVLQSLVAFTIPILISMLLQIAYGTADLFIVGQFSDVINVSGVSIGSQLSQIFTNFCVGLSMGTTVLIGRYIGEKKPEKASQVVGASIFMFSVLALICTVLIMGFSNQLVRLMQTPQESFVQARTYLLISGAGCIFIVGYNLLGSIFRGIGDSKTPLLAVAIACVLNIVLDLIFVGGFNMGANGAAIATVIAQASSVLISVIVIAKKGLPFNFEKSSIYYNKKYIKNIIKIGIPSALQIVLTNFSFLVISSLLNALGVAASAAVGIVGKITAFILVVPQAFGQSLSAFTAQNLGANKKERANKGMYLAVIISLVYGTITGYLSFVHGTIFTNVFNTDAETTLAALDYMKAYSPDCILVAFLFSFNGYLNGCGKTKFTMINGVASSFLMRIPLSYYFSTLNNPSLLLIGLAIPISTFVQIMACVTYMKYTNTLKTGTQSIKNEDKLKGTSLISEGSETAEVLPLKKD